jgi:uncharacterized tellurite resistance protein B-like protein
MLIDWLKKALATPEQIPTKTSTVLAAVGLIVEVMHADHQCTDEEVQQLRRIALDELGVDASELDGVLQIALDDHKNRVSLHPLTRLINDTFPAEKKAELMQAMWKIAFADGDLEKYEENTIRKIADLIYIPHSVFIRTKLQVSEGRKI